MLKIAVCDDEALMCSIVKQKIENQMGTLTEPFEIACYTNTTALMESSFPYDILLLDIQMPGINGIEFAKKLRRDGNQCAIIFITVIKEHVFDAFEVEAVDYICKPVDDIRLKNALFRAVQRLKYRNEKYLFIQTISWCKTIKLSSIYYCEVINRKIYLHTENGTVEYYSKLEEVEKQLDCRFIKCHRSYIVNLDFLYEYKNGQLILENGEYVPVSRPRQKQFMKQMLEYMKNREDLL